MNEEAMRDKARRKTGEITDLRIAVNGHRDEEELLLGAGRILDEWLEELSDQASLILEPRFEGNWKGGTAFSYHDNVRMPWKSNQDDLTDQIVEMQRKISDALKNVREKIASKNERIGLLTSEIDAIDWELRMV